MSHYCHKCSRCFISLLRVSQFHTFLSVCAPCWANPQTFRFSAHIKLGAKILHPKFLMSEALCTSGSKQHAALNYWVRSKHRCGNQPPPLVPLPQNKGTLVSKSLTRKTRPCQALNYRDPLGLFGAGAKRNLLKVWK